MNQTDIQLNELNLDMKQRILTDSRVAQTLPISSPNTVVAEIPQSERSAQTVVDGRDAAISIIHGRDSRLLVIVGPCSIHDEKAALEYAEWLVGMRQKFGSQLELVMRTYLEKPRTTVGWKGIINDPHLDDSFDMETGLRIARRLLHAITELGVPVSTELLDLRTPQYTADLISWGAIGARTVESQTHRELASAVSYPVGFKNSTGGGIRVAVDALQSAATPHSFLGMDMNGKAAIITTEGNRDTHLILRGGKHGPNYDEATVAEAVEKLQAASQNQSVMIDCSHANSGKDYTRQIIVATEAARQIATGNQFVHGVMIESNLVAGSQKLGPNLTYGQSVTDGCADLDDTAKMLEILAEAVVTRQKGN